MSDTTFMKMNADRYIRMALEEDITSEDISTNCVMPEYQKGQVDLICKQDGVICGLWVFQRVFELLDDKGGRFRSRRRSDGSRDRRYPHSVIR